MDRAAARRIVASLALEPREAVVEIGPGRGALTELLLRDLERIAAVELDPELARLLRKRFGPERLVLVEADILRIRLGELARALGATDTTTRLVIVGNLPFNVSKPLASKLVRERADIARAVLTFQQEVAERLIARPGSRAYGPLGVLAGEAFVIERLFDLKAAAFRPRPAVISTVTSWTARPIAEFPPEAERGLRACLAACFARRRRTLFNNLRAALGGGEGAARELLQAAGVDGDLRAEAIAPEVFRRLASLWPG